MTRVPSEPIVGSTAPTWRLDRPEWLPWPPDASPQVRVLIDNDFAGDPDDLFQFVHHLLSPSVEIPAVLCTRDPGADDPRTSGSLRVARDVMDRMGIVDSHLLHPGSDLPVADPHSPRRSDAVTAILAEAARDDSRPLFYAAGAGLTELASAYLIDPTIAQRITLVWIGGAAHPDITGAPTHFAAEYNRDMDLTAAQVVFAAGFEIWQIPRDVYRRCILAESELRERVAGEGGPLGAYLYDEIRHVLARLTPAIGRAEMYPMGDQPLVLLTVLQGTSTDDDFSSNRHVTKPTPLIADDGSYTERADGRPMRVYVDLDFRLMFEDFYLKLREFARWQAASARTA